MVVELIKVFEKKGYILGFDVNHSKSTFALRPTNQFPSCQRVIFYSRFHVLGPQTVSMHLVNVINHLGVQFKCAHSIDQH